MPLQNVSSKSSTILLTAFLNDPSAFGGLSYGRYIEMTLTSHPPHTSLRAVAIPIGIMEVFTTLEQRSEKNTMSPPTEHFDLLLGLDSIFPLQVFPVTFLSVKRYPAMYLALPSSDLASVMHIMSASCSRAVSEIFSQLVEFQQFAFQNTTFRDAECSSELSGDWAALGLMDEDTEEVPRGSIVDDVGEAPRGPVDDGVGEATRGPEDEDVEEATRGPVVDVGEATRSPEDGDVGGATRGPVVGGVVEDSKDSDDPWDEEGPWDPVSWNIEPIAIGKSVGWEPPGSGADSEEVSKTSCERGTPVSTMPMSLARRRIALSIDSLS